MSAPLKAPAVSGAGSHCPRNLPSSFAALTMVGVTMARPNSSDDLIAAIYDVIIEPSGWDEVVNRIVAATPSMSGGLIMEEANAEHRVELAEWQLLETLAPHLQRAAAIHDLLDRVRAVTRPLGSGV